MELQPEHFFNDFEIIASTARVKLKYLLLLKQCCKAVNLEKNPKTTTTNNPQTQNPSNISVVWN